MITVRRDALLGEFRFVSRTFEGGFKDNPFVLDMDGNLFVGPADQQARDEHGAISLVYHYLAQTSGPLLPVRGLLRHRLRLLEAFAAFDAARDEGREEFRLHLFGTWDGELLRALVDDELPCGPCGRSVNELKRALYERCRRLDPDFDGHVLEAHHREAQARFWPGEEADRAGVDEGSEQGQGALPASAGSRRAPVDSP